VDARQHELDLTVAVRGNFVNPSDSSEKLGATQIVEQTNQIIVPDSLSGKSRCRRSIKNTMDRVGTVWSISREEKTSQSTKCDGKWVRGSHSIQDEWSSYK